jgi:hypothetical protein
MAELQNTNENKSLISSTKKHNLTFTVNVACLIQICITYSKGRREASFHPSVLSSIRPSVWSSIRLVMVCLLRWGKERVEYRHGAVENNIYKCCKFLFFILGFLDLSTLILSLSQQLKELGWAFFFLFFFEILFRILEIFNAFYIAIIFFSIVQWMPEQTIVKHTFIRY